MAKTARRSVASDPSLPLSFRSFIEYRQRRLTANKGSPSRNAQTSTNDNSTHQTRRKSRSNIVYNDGHINKNHTERTPSPTPYSPPETHYIINATAPPSLEFIAAQRERVRMEFFATYDVMTGVRIAATLGGFFGLMVFLVIYKSRGAQHETLKALKDPKIAAVAAAVMQEEEDRELQEAMEATGMSIYPDVYDHIGYRRRRMMSIGNVSAPPILNRNFRFSSIGGYSSLIGPPHRRYSCSTNRRKSNSVESSKIFSAYPMGGSFGIDDYFIESDGDEADDEYDQLTNAKVSKSNQYQLSVPPEGQESRRSSNITCCSSESSYLERRCSSITLGLAPLSPIASHNPSRCPSATDMWDYFYPTPDIQVIQATPKTSPCPSERCNQTDDNDKHCSVVGNRRRRKPQKSLSEQDSFDYIGIYPDASKYDEIEEEEAESVALAEHISRLNQNNRILETSLDTFTSSLLNRRAPLASLSSFKISSIDYQDSDLRSLGSDSVFVESYADTDDDMEQFSTDSNEESDALCPPHTKMSRSMANRLASNYHHQSTVSADIELKPRDMHDTMDAVTVSGDTKHGNLFKSTQSMHSKRSLKTSHFGESSNMQNDLFESTKRPASYSGSTTTSLNLYQKNNNNIRNDNIKLSNDNNRSSKSTSNMAEGILISQRIVSLAKSQQPKQPKHLKQPKQPKQPPQPQQPQQPQRGEICHGFLRNHPSGHSPIESGSKINVVTTVVETRPRQSIVSPSVILELPVIVSTQEQSLEDNEQQPNSDSSLPGPSRKRSRETLF